MFHNPTIVGSWPALVERLGDESTLVRWAADEPALHGLTTVDELLALWAQEGEANRIDAVLAALVRLAAVDGEADDDALLLSLHLLSGLVWGLARQLRDLTPDVVSVIVAELTCQIRGYPWRRRPRAVAANLRLETRKAVLAELRPSGRDRLETLAIDGNANEPHIGCWQLDADVDVADLFEWAVRSGVDPEDIALLMAIESGRARGQWRSDEHVAAAYGITARTLYRRRKRALAALRGVASEYLAAVA